MSRALPPLLTITQTFDTTIRLLDVGRLIASKSCNDASMARLRAQVLRWECDEFPGWLETHRGGRWWTPFPS